MYRGYKLNANTISLGAIYKSIGEAERKRNTDIVDQSLSRCKGINGKINASKLESTWFPLVEADVFISHSHKDEDFALRLSGWLSKTFKLRSFIDSCVWNYADNLIKIIDEAYCIEDGKFNYELRNRSTSHVHLMLASALTKMINKTECLIFVNSQNSISPDKSINRTGSPWIYHEINVAEMIKKVRKRKPVVAQEGRRMVNASAMPNFEYDVNLDIFDDISMQTLYRWSKRHSFQSSNHALDTLYSMTTKQPQLLNG